MASYNYENSDPERFQQLVQALLVIDQPRLQCLPVGQPDGGRDGLVFDPDARLSDVLQVKFKRADEPAADSAKWLIDSLEKELPKIDAMVERGLKTYTVATNARGTAHLDGGSIDRVQRWLDENVRAAAQCLWRDDVDRRLEAALSVQWRYPEVLSGPDAIHLALLTRINEDRDRREVALRKFLKYQFGKDSEVRFKQVDLRNDLIGLFVDVSATVSQGAAVRSTQEFMNACSRLPSAQWYGDRLYDTDRSSPYWMVSAGTADLLLDDRYVAAVPSVVLEGAPGQGKSTLAQYVCQVHRARLLEDGSALADMPERHLRAAVRFPIKVDLRDLATWLGRCDPFLPDNPAAGPDWSPDLESFLARQISAQSGAIEFTSYDLTASFRSAPILLFLDGFDEVAGTETRERLIDVVRTGTARLQASGLQLQVVVTSRPAAFVNSPGFDRREFAHLELTSLSRELVLDYAERWIRARELDDIDASEVRRILGSKLDLTHIREIARNPMQLAILLSLIHAVGYSLPDERTELYASYMDRFLTREADKSPTVRRHRKLLVKIHQHLAWILQSRAESQAGLSGSVTPSELRKIIRNYLQDHEHDTSIVEELFTGVLERVYVLVQRVEGAYEFEVQPLREYFCARHLYDTAAAYEVDGGAGPHGAKPERFDALARNAYWTNVARFYAGCYRSGELGGLYMQLEEFRDEPAYARTFRPRLFGAMLLGDWVFKESPRATAHVAKCVFDELGLIGAATSYGQGPGHSLVLPDGCGRTELGSAALAAMVADPRTPARRELASVVAANATDAILGAVRERLAGSSGDERSLWCGFAAQAGALAAMPDKELADVVFGDGPSQLAVRVRCTQVFLYAPEAAQACRPVVTELIAMAGTGRLGAPGGRTTWIEVFADLLSTWSERMRLEQRHGGVDGTDVATIRAGSASIRSVSSGAADFLEAACALDQEDNGGKLQFGRRLVEAVRGTLGPVWAGYVIAALYAGVPSSRGERGENASSLFDYDAGLVSAARRGRYWSGGAWWWSDQLKLATSANERMFWVLMLLLWGRASSIESLIPLLDEVVVGLSSEEFEDLFLAFGDCAPGKLPGGRSRRQGLAGVRAESGRLGALLDELKDGAARQEALCEPGFETAERVVQRARDSALLRSVIGRLDRGSCDAALPEIRRLYRDRGAVFGGFPERRRFLTESAAGAILSDPFDYPPQLVARSAEYFAEKISVVPVAQAAALGQWTFE